MSTIHFREHTAEGVVPPSVQTPTDCERARKEEKFTQHVSGKRLSPEFATLCVCTWVAAKRPAVAWRLAPALGVRQTFIAALLCAASSVADPELERPAATIAVRFLTTHRLCRHPWAILEAIVLIF